ncbi:MAG TPA: histidine kinase dimerization/phospho-acceptor domain-containing protein, partial [Chthoniobacterales bacterium]|nr:histidine kinase dimerization/phospho-acceptor domain-containing protein [Chthoniobacterales bacterium]
MGWILAIVVCVGLFVLAIALWRRWVRPWRDVEQLVDDVINARTPRTFLVDGNAAAQRIGVALENVFLRHRDLTSRAREGELNTRTILGAMRDGLAVVDADGRVRLLNRVVREMFAIADEQLGERVLETFRDGLVADIVARTLRSGAPETGSINLRSGTDDAMRRVSITSLPIAENGEPHGAVVLFHDVTQLQQLEQVRREFVSNVSHELRTPLSIFRGYLETLLDEPDLPADERERILRVLEKHSTRLHSLVDDLLSLARLEAPDPQLNFAPVALGEFLHRVARDWEKRAAAKQLTIVQEITSDLPAVEADEARLEEVMYNLLDNAMKYSPTNARITITTARDGENAITISVRDEGTGIAAADLPRIFERFYRADKARSRDVGGTGL